MMEPDFASDDRGDKVHVRVRIPGLKPQSRLFGPRTAEAQNAQVEPTFEERFFRLVVQGEANLFGKTYQLERNLRKRIRPHASYVETEKDFVRLYLVKEDPSLSWEADCRNGFE